MEDETFCGHPDCTLCLSYGWTTSSPPQEMAFFHPVTLLEEPPDLSGVGHPMTTRRTVLKSLALTPALAVVPGIAAGSQTSWLHPLVVRERPILRERTLPVVGGRFSIMEGEVFWETLEGWRSYDMGYSNGWASQDPVWEATAVGRAYQGLSYLAHLVRMGKLPKVHQMTLPLLQSRLCKLESVRKTYGGAEYESYLAEGFPGWSPDMHGPAPTTFDELCQRLGF